MTNIKKLKKIIIIIFVLVFIIGILLIFLSNRVNNDEEEQGHVHAEEDLDNQNIERVKDDAIFYTIEDCIEQYEVFASLDYTKQVDELNYPSVAAVYNINNEQEKKDAIISLLDKEYINKNKIDENNLYEFIKEDKQDNIDIKALKINKLVDSDLEVQAYSAYIQKEYSQNKNIEYKYYIVKIDKSEEVFCIYPLDNNYKDIDEIKINNNTTNIEKNDRNTFLYSDINESQIATKYFQEVKELLINNPDEVYKRLDEEYKKKRFGSEEEFINYVSENIEDIKLMQIYKYLLNSYSDYDEYVAKDRNDNLFIFKEKYPNDYSVKFDTYTIVTDKFKDEYNNTKDEKRVQMQLDVFKQMINNRDFKSAYKLLDDQFKNNNFKTENKFKEFVESKSFRYNEIEFKRIQKEGKTYICNLTMKDLTKEDDNEYNWEFMIQLNDAENFKISFNTD